MSLEEIHTCQQGIIIKFGRQLQSSVVKQDI